MPHEDTRQHPHAFQTVVARCDPAIARLAFRARTIVLEVLPAAYEVVWAHASTIGYGTGPRKRTDHFCWIAASAMHVTLGFNYGAELADPGRILEGTGRRYRHLTLLSRDDVERPAVRALIAAATRHRVIANAMQLRAVAAR